jgi:hypothetical protein
MDAPPWRGFIVRFLAVFVAVLAATFAFVILIDPYDSGRFPSIGISGVSDVTQRTLNVSLGRSEKFDAAIFGNSHGQLLDPERQATRLLPPRGHDDYEKGRPADYRFDFPKRIPSVRWLIAVTDLGARAFPAIDRLAAELAAAPAGTPLVVVFPPVYYAALPHRSEADRGAARMQGAAGAPCCGHAAWGRSRLSGRLAADARSGELPGHRSLSLAGGTPDRAGDRRCAKESGRGEPLNRDDASSNLAADPTSARPFPARPPSRSR